MVVGVDIQGVGTAGFFETRTRSSNHRQATLDGFDDRNAEAFIARRIDTRLSHLIDGRQMLIRYLVKEQHTRRKTVLFHIAFHLFAIGCAATHDDQTDVVGQQRQCLHGQQDVLPLLNSSHADDIASGQHVASVDVLQTALSLARLEIGAARLIDHADFLFRHIAEMHDVALRALADGDDMIGFTQRATELPLIESGVDSLIVFRMAQENEVVDSDDGTNASITQTLWQFTREAVEQLHAIALQVFYNASRAPIRLIKRGEWREESGERTVERGER